MREKTVKVSEDEYNKIIKVMQLLAQKGFSRLSSRIYKGNSIDFTQGAIVGLGMDALIYLMNKEE